MHICSCVPFPFPIIYPTAAIQVLTSNDKKRVMNTSELLTQLLNVAVTCDGELRVRLYRPTWLTLLFEYSRLSNVANFPILWLVISPFSLIARHPPPVDTVLTRNLARQTTCLVRVLGWLRWGLRVCQQTSSMESSRISLESSPALSRRSYKSSRACAELCPDTLFFIAS